MSKIKQVATDVAYEYCPALVEVLGRILVGLPGGEALEDLYEPLDLGWREIALLAEWLGAIEGASDVALIAEALLEPQRFWE